MFQAVEAVTHRLDSRRRASAHSTEQFARAGSAAPSGPPASVAKLSNVAFLSEKTIEGAIERGGPSSASFVLRESHGA